MVDLYRSGKNKATLVKDYDLTPSALDKWIKQANTTGSFRHADNLSDEEKEIIELRKRNKQLEMEVDILK